VVLDRRCLFYRRVRYWAYIQPTSFIIVGRPCRVRSDIKAGRSPSEQSLIVDMRIHYLLFAVKLVDSFPSLVLNSNFTSHTSRPQTSPYTTSYLHILHPHLNQGFSILTSIALNLSLQVFVNHIQFHLLIKIFVKIELYLSKINTTSKWCPYSLLAH